jgi:hypothetical protein
MESSTVFPFTPSVVTTTPEFSRTSLSFRPRQRTKTLIFVALLCPSIVETVDTSGSNSRSLRFMPAIEDIEPAGEDRPVKDGATDGARNAAFRRAGGGIAPRTLDGGRDISRLIIMQTGVVDET